MFNGHEFHVDHLASQINHYFGSDEYVGPTHPVFIRLKRYVAEVNSNHVPRQKADDHVWQDRLTKNLGPDDTPTLHQRWQHVKEHLFGPKDHVSTVIDGIYHAAR